MNSKYFNITVKPDITGANAVTAFADDDVMFDWTAFKIMKGGARLIGITAVCKGTNAVRQKPSMDVYFAKAQDDGTAPATLGTVNASSSTAQYYNQLMGCLNIPGGSFRDGLDFHSIAHNNFIAETGGGFIMDDVTPSDGYNTYYLGVIAKGAWDFGTACLADDPISAGASVAVVKGTDSRKCFAPGDVLIDNGNAAIGTVKSLASATNITFVGTTTEAVAADDEIVCKNPITYILHFEK